MFTKQNLKSALKELAGLNLRLLEKGGPSADGNLLGEILEKREIFFSYFGLPHDEYEELLLFPSIPSEKDLNKRLNLIHKKAKTYLSSNPKSEQYCIRIISINCISSDKIKVAVEVFDKNEYDLIFQFQDKASNFKVHIHKHIFEVENTVMAPIDNELISALDIHAKYEYPHNLNPSLRRQWHTASLVDNLTVMLMRHFFLFRNWELDDFGD